LGLDCIIVGRINKFRGVNAVVKAIWNGAVLAESDQTIIVEGNHYFPPNSINEEYFVESDSHTVCSWKGVASYYDVKVDGKTNRNAAWYYPEPQPAAEKIAGYVAFWHGVQVGQE
jgi:uncharacterized protein (DUF427 family)